MKKIRNRGLNTLLRNVFIGFILLFCILPAGADGFRNITSIIYSYYFNETYRLDTNDVFMTRISPAIWLKADIARVDAGAFETEDIDGSSWYELFFTFGPVISFTKTFYMDAVYGFGINSDGYFSHKGDISFTHETETSTISFGARMNYYVLSKAEEEYNDYYYYLPTISASIFPIPELRLFVKLFFSQDKEGVVSGSVWGEGGWEFTSLFLAHTGFTLSLCDDGFGYSIIGGFKLKFTETISLKYFCQYLSNAVEYLGEVTVNDGIANGIIVDFRF